MALRRLCIDGCGRTTAGTRCAPCESAWQARRNARPERAIYGGDWPAESRRIREAHPWCTSCGSFSDLTVDHPTRAVLCRGCHARLENRRRARGRAVKSLEPRRPRYPPQPLAMVGQVQNTQTGGSER